MKNVLVTNGSVQEEPLLELLPLIDAMNIDVKGFTGDYYRKTCHGRLAPVKRTVELVHSRCHLEVTTLLVPTLNDSDGEITALVDWLAGLNPEIPIHFSRYFPQYQMDLPPTPLETLRRAREIACRKLKYVYIGNAPDLGDDQHLLPGLPQPAHLAQRLPDQHPRPEERLLHQVRRPHSRRFLMAPCRLLSVA